MSVKQILTMGHPLLYRKSDDIEDIHSTILTDLLTDMRDTMNALDGIGIAAPQIGVNLRVIIYGFDSNPRYPDAPAVPATTLINPYYEAVGDKTEEDWEGCLSLPGLRGLVPRYTKVRCTGLDLHGEKVDLEVDGFHARVLQHEIDHLDGVLYPQRVRDIHNLGYEQELFPDV